MGFLDFLRPKSDPAWLPVFTRDEWAELRSAIDAHFRSRGCSPTWSADQAVLEIPEGSSYGHGRAGLENLAQRCRRVPRRHWPQVIAEHFDNLEVARAQAGELRTRLASYQTARELLRSRLYPSDLPPGMDLVRRPVTPLVDLVLVLDLPTTVQTVDAADVAAWGLSHDELLDRGLEAVRDELGDTAPEFVERDGARIAIIQTDSFFTATLAACIPADEEGPHGTIVGMPTRDVLLSHRIVAADSAVRAVNAIAALTLDLHAKGPGSLSPHACLLRRGTFHPITAEREGKSLRVMPPDELVAVLEQLSAGTG